MRSHFSVFTTLKAVNTSGKLLQSKPPASMKSLATKFTRFFYGEVKDIVEHRYSARYRAVHLLNVGINFCFILRFGYILLARQRPLALALLPDERHDIFVRIFSLDRVNEKGERDLSMVFTFIGLAVSSALLEVKLYFSRIDTLTWQMFYDLVVQNLDLYRQCVKEAPRRRAILAERVKELQNNNNNSGRRRGSTSVLGLFTGVFARFRAATAIWYHLDYVDKEQLDERKLSSYPEMTLALRTRLIVALSIANKISCSCIITLYFSFTFFAAYYFFQIIEEFPPWYVPLVALELTYFSYMVIRILEILIFETNLASSSAILFISYIQEANVYLHEVLQQEKLGHSHHHHQITSRSNGGGGGNHYQNGGPSSSGAKMASALWRFLAKHTHISHQIIYAGQEMWAAVLMISMSYHIPNNAYLMIRLLQGSRTMVTWTVCIVQIVYILVTLLFLAAYSKVLHAAKNDLTSVQLLMTGRRHLGAKWKCLAIYELLNSGKQIGITIGPSNTITFRVVFEIVLYYFALLLFIMKSLR